MRELTALMLLVVIAAPAAAEEPITFRFDFLDPTPVLGAGWRTCDIVINTQTDWLSAALIVWPHEPGMIYQHVFGASTSAGINPAFFEVYPGLQYDTYVGNGAFLEDIDTAAPVDQGYGSIVFDADRLAISWSTTDTDDIGELTLARLTLSNQAIGIWCFCATAENPGLDAQGNPLPPYKWEVVSGTFENGFIPEPTAMALLGIGGLAALIRRKRA